ncbi:nuclear pore protein-like protein [Colletotrichum camelliae]|nr:nuclear pore protein-like protein [Colletotrichum camelliae]
MPAAEKPWHWLKAAMEAPGAFVMDPRGDLRLNITPESDIEDEDHGDRAAPDAPSDTSDAHEHTQQFLVCSKAMARISVVFCKMLFGPFSEGLRDEQKTIDLEDAIEPMFFALCIVHSRYDMIQTALTVKELFQLLVVTNKYDMTSIVRPWIHQWVPLLKHIDEEFYEWLGHLDIVLVAWIAWEVGAEKLFELAVKTAALHCWVNQDGEFLGEHGKLMKLNVHVDAAGIIDVVTGLRKDLVSRMLSPLQQYAWKIMEGTACTHEIQSDDCDAASLSSIVSALKQAEIDPIPLYSKENLIFEGCAENLRCDLDQRGNLADPYQPHKCNPMREAALAVSYCDISRMDWPMTQSQRQHLAKQARITGWNRLD